MRSRPRRSAPTSYKHLFPAIDDSDDDDAQGTSGEVRAGSGATTGSPKGKRRAARRVSDDDDDDDETTGSEYNAEEAAQDAPSESESAGDSVVASADEDEDGDRDGDEDADDGHLIGGPIGSRIAYGGGGGKRPASSSTKVQRTTTVASVRGRTNSAKQRVKAPFPMPKTGMQGAWANVGPQFEPPVRKLDGGDGDNERGFRGAKVEYRPPLDDRNRSVMLEAWSMTPFGPERMIVQDLGWCKGKWDQERIKQRWGGWYPDVKVPESVPLELRDAGRYMPAQVFPSTPARVDKGQEQSGISAEDVARTDDADDDQAMDAAAETTGNKGPLSVDDADLDADDGKDSENIKMWVGGLSTGQQQRKVSLAPFETHRLDEYLTDKPGHVINAGGPVSGLDWCPRMDSAKEPDYLAIATLSSADAPIGSPGNVRPSIIQIWSLDTTGGADISLRTDEAESRSNMKLELALCVDDGEVVELRWCPKGGDAEQGATNEPTDNKLGLLACALTDGSVSVFAVPKPINVIASNQTIAGETLHLKINPVLKLLLPDTACVSIAWGSHARLAAGCDNGYIAVWDLAQALEAELPFAPRPTVYARTNSASVRSIAFIKTPPLSAKLNGTLDRDAEPTLVVASGYNGLIACIDISDPATNVIVSRDRGTFSAVSYVPHLGMAAYADADAFVRAAFLRPAEYWATKAVTKLAGPVRTIEASDHHPFVAIGSADGSCTIATVARGSKRKAPPGHYTQTVFKLDYNRNTGEYRMLDNFHIHRNSGVDALAKRKNTDKKSKTVHLVGAWHPGVAVTRVAWNPQLTTCCLVASGAANGLVRVDWVEGGQLA